MACAFTIFPSYNAYAGDNPFSSAELYDSDSGTWTNTGAMNGTRRYHTATLLPNGKVLVAGGSGSNGVYNADLLTSAELYNPATGTWTNTGALPDNVGRENHSATLLPNGKVLVTGGIIAFAQPYEGATLYSPASGTWTPTQRMKYYRGHHTATLLFNGKVLIAGNYGGGIFSSAELFDPATETWANTGSLNIARGKHTATLLPNGKVLVAAGQGNSGYLSSAEFYDPTTGTWTTTGALTTNRIYHTATLLPSGKVLVVGGNDTGPLINTEMFGSIAGTKTLFGLPRQPSEPFQFAFASNPNRTNTAFATTRLPTALADWAELGVVPEFSPGLYLYTDLQATNSDERFYQVR